MMMSWLKYGLRCALLISLGAVLIGCQQKSSDSGNTLKVGTIAGPETQLMEEAKDVAKKQANVDIEIVPFTDYSMPNAALADGSIDANVFQHAPYLTAAEQAKGYKFAVVGKTFVYPMGIYSKKIQNLAQLPQGAVIAIPNDPSNEARALLLLQKAQLITLKPGVTTSATLIDIAKNPHQLKFKEIDAAQLPRVLPDVDLAAINTNYSMLAGLLPSKDALVVEDGNSPYANLIVVRQGQEQDPRVQALVKALHSKEVLQKANQLFEGQAVSAWE